MRPRGAGFTLIELLTVIAVAAILVSVAIPSFGYLTANTKVKSTATELYLALIRARSEAVKRNGLVTIAPTGGSWQAGWQIKDAADNVLINQGQLKGVTITLGPASVVYLTSGRIQGAAAPTFLITSQKDPEIKRCVLADLTGRPYIKTEATTCP